MNKNVQIPDKNITIYDYEVDFFSKILDRDDIVVTCSPKLSDGYFIKTCGDENGQNKKSLFDIRIDEEKCRIGLFVQNKPIAAGYGPHHYHISEKTKWMRIYVVQESEIDQNLKKLWDKARYVEGQQQCFKRKKDRLHNAVEYIRQTLNMKSY